MGTQRFKSHNICGINIKACTHHWLIVDMLISTHYNTISSSCFFKQWGGGHVVLAFSCFVLLFY